MSFRLSLTHILYLKDIDVLLDIFSNLDSNDYMIQRVKTKISNED
jgi:hypothetical protein